MGIKKFLWRSNWYEYSLFNSRHIWNVFTAFSIFSMLNLQKCAYKFRTTSPDAIIDRCKILNFLWNFLLKKLFYIFILNSGRMGHHSTFCALTGDTKIHDGKVFKKYFEIIIGKFPVFSLKYKNIFIASQGFVVNRYEISRFHFISKLININIDITLI